MVFSGSVISDEVPNCWCIIGIFIFLIILRSCCHKNAHSSPIGPLYIKRKKKTQHRYNEIVLWRVVLTNVVYTNHAMYGACCSRTVPMHSEHGIFNWARDSLIPIDSGSRLFAPKSWSNHQNLLQMLFLGFFTLFLKNVFNCSNTVPAVHELKLKLNGEFFWK